jgi:hypothetical protein
MNRTAASAKLSLNQASKRLGLDARFIRGFAECMGIELIITDWAIFMTQSDFQRLSARIEQRRTCAETAS